jgi:hypothetical protein
MTTPDCTWDNGRQCRKCRCSPAKDGIDTLPPTEQPYSH